MRTAQRLQPATPTLDDTDRLREMTILSELVAHLCERVELLETRELLGRASFASRAAGAAAARE